VKCFVITVIIGTTGIISKSLKNLETIPGQHSIHFLQKKRKEKYHSSNITHHKKSAAICDLRPEWWSSPLAQEEKYKGKENM
jgi:hypothetical protein